jgi:branched-chain amino acid transport system substrate-binding protein
MVTNYYKAGNYFRGMFEFYIDFEVPPERALRILNAAVKNVQQQITEITDEYPNPISGKDLESDAIALGITEFGIKYRVRYWIANYSELMSTRNKMVISVMQQLKQAGITPVFLRQDFVATPPSEEHLDETAMKLKLLDKVDFLASLQKMELNNLANNLKERNFMSGESIVKQGDPGDSMFIIAEGLVYVHVYFPEEEESVKMSQLTAGSFFGEMCLLTGEPRAATITAATDVLLYEITKDTMAELLQNRPVIAGKISEIIAKYRKSTQEVKEKLANSEHDEDSGHLTAQLLGKIKHFFGID